MTNLEADNLAYKNVTTLHALVKVLCLVLVISDNA
jgi:hypothetical protein